MQRRRALQLLGALAGAPAIPALRHLSADDLLALGARVHEQLEPTRGGAPRALTAGQYRVVEVAAEHIIPRTDTPGATDARVADFVDTMLADWYGARERDRFLEGLAALDARAMRAHGRRFVDVPERDRFALLTLLDAEVATLRRAQPRVADEHWFATLKYLTAWGYYTSKVGITEELRVQLMPGRYDGNAPMPAAPARRDEGHGVGVERSGRRSDA